MKPHLFFHHKVNLLFILLIYICCTEQPIESDFESNLIIKTLSINNLNISNYSVPPNLSTNERLYIGEKNGIQILVPPYYGNGYLCLSKECLFHYKLSYSGKYFDVQNQFSIKWNDPKIKIKWPIKNPILSVRDKKTKVL